MNNRVNSCGYASENQSANIRQLLESASQNVIISYFPSFVCRNFVILSWLNDYVLNGGTYGRFVTMAIICDNFSYWYHARFRNTHYPLHIFLSELQKLLRQNVISPIEVNRANKYLVYSADELAGLYIGNIWNQDNIDKYHYRVAA